jgi:hypothetical protein
MNQWRYPGNTWMDRHEAPESRYLDEGRDLRVIII